MSPVSNDNESVPTPTPTDAPGQAALLLVESLIHGLIAKSQLSVADAVEIIDTATSVSHDMAKEFGNDLPGIQGSRTLLEAISRSLGRDLPRR